MLTDKQEVLKKHVSYNKETGDLYYNNKKIQRDYQGFAIIRIDKKLTIKIKIEKLACLLAFNRLPEANERVLFKNLDENDLRLRNLAIVNRDVYLQIKEAKLNLESCLCLIPHESDVFSFWLCYRENALHKRELIRDIVVAKREFNKKKLIYTKIINKHCLFD